MYKKIFEEITVKKFPKMGKEIPTQVQEAQRGAQDTLKEKHSKTHIN